MAKRRRNRKQKSKLVDLVEKLPKGNLELPSLSLDPSKVEGLAFRFTILLPIISESGEEVFSREHDLPVLARLFDDRFGGSIVSESTTHAPWVGSYLPKRAKKSVKDYHTLFVVYANQIPEAEEFFKQLKAILKESVQQEEVLIEMLPVSLLGSKE